MSQFVQTEQRCVCRATQRGQTVGSSVQDSAGHLHQKDVDILDSSVHISGQDRWFEKGLLEAINVQLERPSMNRGGGGLQHQLSVVCPIIL